MRVPMDGAGAVAADATQPTDLVWHAGRGAKWPTGTRFVDAAFDDGGRLFVSSDGRDGVVALLHGGIACGAARGCAPCCRLGRGAPGSGSFCAPDCRCAHGEGDCDRDGHCAAGTRCATDVGAAHGFAASTDVCETTKEPTTWPTTRWPSKFPTTRYPSSFPSRYPSKFPTRT